MFCVGAGALPSVVTALLISPGKCCSPRLCLRGAHPQQGGNQSSKLYVRSRMECTARMWRSRFIPLRTTESLIVSWKEVDAIAVYSVMGLVHMSEIRKESRFTPFSKENRKPSLSAKSTVLNCLYGEKLFLKGTWKPRIRVRERASVDISNVSYLRLCSSYLVLPMTLLFYFQRTDNVESALS